MVDLEGVVGMGWGGAGWEGWGGGMVVSAWRRSERWRREGERVGRDGLNGVFPFVFETYGAGCVTPGCDQWLLFPMEDCILLLID